MEKSYNYITFYPRSLKRSSKPAATKCPFFEAGQDYIFMVGHDRVSFMRPSLDYTGPTLRANRIGSGWINFSIADHLIPPHVGRVYFDMEESTEDFLVAYFEDDQP